MEELEFCLKIWENEGGCAFGERTDCKNCAASYLLLKLVSGRIIHGGEPRLTLEDWKKELNGLKN